jgi:hypothetical protein
MPMPSRFTARSSQWILSIVYVLLVSTYPLLGQDELARPPGPGGLAIPPGPLAGMVCGFVVLALLLWGVKQPLAWIVVSFVAIGAGVGCAGYGVAQALLTSGPRPRQEVEWVSSFIGGGVGATTAGIVLLVVSLLRRRKMVST